MRAIWSDEHRFELWLRIEILACEAWAELGRVPRDALPKIRQASFDVARIQQVEESVGHDVIAFLTVVGETVGQPEARWLHLGLTSSDVVDTAFALQVKASAELIQADLGKLREACAGLALEHRRTPMVGRTHGIHAEPITFGLKVAGWVAELDRARERLAAATMERIALEIRHLQRSEVAEAREPFGAEQKGSSAMPHKRNPVLTERICGLARVVRGYAATELENVALWHERDISHSSAERVIFPDGCALLDYMAIQLAKVIKGLDVRVEQMRRNLDLWGGVVFSQRVLLALVESGLSREDAYRLVQSAAHRAIDGEGGFRANLLESAEVGERIGARLDELFDPSADLEQVDVAFERLGLLHGGVAGEGLRPAATRGSSPEPVKVKA